MAYAARMRALARQGTAHESRDVQISSSGHRIEALNSEACACGVIYILIAQEESQNSLSGHFFKVPGWRMHLQRK
jgi:hypothetical protein